MEVLSSAPIRSSCVQIFLYLRGLRELYWCQSEADSHNALHAAALFGLPAAAKELLATDIPVDAPTTIGTTALMRAASHGNTHVMRLLLDEKADPTLSNWYGTSLHVAAEAGQCEAITMLLQNGVGIDMKDQHGRTAFYCAWDQQHYAAIALLCNASPWQTHLNHDIAVRRVGRSGCQLFDLEYSDPRKRKVDPRSLLQVSIEDNDVEFTKLLLANGANVERLSWGHSYRGKRPLHWAASPGSTEIARMLLEAGANVNSVCYDGHTAYWYALSSRYTEIQSLLVQYGAAVCEGPEDQLGSNPCIGQDGSPDG